MAGEPRVELVAMPNPICPHCQSDRTKRNGKRKTKQRYICLECDRSYVDNPIKPQGRPMLGNRPMTSAEKQKAYRDRAALLRSIKVPMNN